MVIGWYLYLFFMLMGQVTINRTSIYSTGPRGSHLLGFIISSGRVFTNSHPLYAKYPSRAESDIEPRSVVVPSKAFIKFSVFPRNKQIRVFQICVHCSLNDYAQSIVMLS